MPEMTIVMDIDGTLCPIKTADEKYIDLAPYTQVLEKLREYRKNGAYIILYTSRNMKTYGKNIGLINANTAKILLHWLDKWDIPYDEIHYGKPWAGEKGFYVDDRAVRPDEFINCTEDELTTRMAESRKDL
ncbi:HAD family hydrolase [Breznakiellaceae bacterium SP9]